jgi:hypothetical protein
VPGSHRAEYEHREPRDMEGPVQRYAGTGGGRRSVAQGVERFSDGDFLTQG